jgi:hypothetical protein
MRVQITCAVPERHRRAPLLALVSTHRTICGAALPPFIFVVLRHPPVRDRLNLLTMGLNPRGQGPLCGIFWETAAGVPISIAPQRSMRA